ncbi:MAG TPA: LytTR family DNA-binding domain-containing protein [Phenylobacterium sp.]|nr:LytTR family DNA-binding domain-containing protein [Phenylobacterium sp.]
MARRADGFHADGTGCGVAVTPPARSGTSGGPVGTSGWSRDDLVFYGVFLACAAAVATVNAFSRIDELERFQGGRVPLWQPVVWEISSVLLIALLVPAVMWLTRRFAPRPPPPFGWVLAHLGGLVLFSVVHVTGMGLLRALAYQAVGARYDALAPLGNWPYELRKDALIYLAVVAIYTTWRLLRAPPQRPEPQAAALEVRDGARRLFVPVEDILWVEAAGNYVELHRPAGAVLHRAPLQEIEARLAPQGFVRIHRSRLVRRAAIAAIETNPSGDFAVTLKDGRALAGSRRYRQALDAAPA